MAQVVVRQASIIDAPRRAPILQATIVIGASGRITAIGPDEQLVAERAKLAAIEVG